MKYHGLKILFLLFFLLVSKTILAQSEKDFVAIEMKSGEIVYGILLFQSNDIVVIQTQEGSKFQYQQAELKEMRIATPNEIGKYKEIDKKQPTSNLGIIVQIKGGFCSIPHNSNGGFTDVNLIVGHRNVTSKHIFAGIGIGYRGVFTNNNFNFIPLFIHVGTNDNKKRLVPHFSIDAGYAFCTSHQQKSGCLVDISLGGKYRINKQTSLMFDIFGMAQQTNMELIQKINNETFVYNGNTAILGGGLKIGLLF